MKIHSSQRKIKNEMTATAPAMQKVGVGNK